MTLNLVGQLLDYHGNSAKLRIKTTSSIGGTSQETIESIKIQIANQVDYAERTVWKEDYLLVLRQQFPEVVWMEVWGEKEQNLFAGFNLDHINTILFPACENSTLKHWARK